MSEKTRSRLGKAILAGYLLTWSFGLPAAYSTLNAFVFTEYERLRKEGDPRMWQDRIALRHYFSCPVFPGLILSYDAYSVSGITKKREFGLYLWYGPEAKKMVELPFYS